MKSSLLLVLFFSLGSSLWACSCIDVYQPLPELLCFLDSSGGRAMELRLRRTTSDGAFFSVEAVLVGETSRRELFFRNGNGADCGWRVSERNRGERYLYLAYGWDENAETFSTFNCGFSNNLYRLNNLKTQIEYVYPAGGEPEYGYQRAGGLRYQDYYQQLLGADCTLSRGNSNPMDAFFLAPNPGGGMPFLRTAFDTLPAIREIRVFNATGQLVYRSVDFDLTGSLPLRELPSGIYLVMLSDGRNRKTLPYHKF